MNKPVLFLIFNRPDYTRQVFESIRLYKPNKLYIAADGARIDNKDDLLLCVETRKIINLIDWDCEIKTLLRNENLGCKNNVSSAIEWFFENENDGIILEDDVVPNLDFFYFCEFCLNKYQDDERVMMITGTNFLSNDNINSTYFYSKHFSIWGWATWKRAWKNYDVDMKLWNDTIIKNDIKYMFNGNYIWKYYMFKFDSLNFYNIDTWDIQWAFSCLINNGYCITPRMNLIRNIGIHGTHSNKLTDSHYLNTFSLCDTSIYVPPNNFLANSLYDEMLHRNKSKKENAKHEIVKILHNLKLYKLIKKIKTFISN